MTIAEAVNALDVVEHMESFSVLYEPGEPMNQTTVGKLKEACRAGSNSPPWDKPILLK